MVKHNFFDYKNILLNFYKELDLNENDLAVILVCESLLTNGETLIDAETLSIKMTLSNKVIDNVLSKLVEKEYLEYVFVEGKLRASLRKLYKLLEQKAYDFLNSSSSFDKIENQDRTILQEMAILFKRELSPLEHTRIIDWLRNGYLKNQILEATNEVISKNSRVSIAAIDKILLKKDRNEKKEAIEDDLEDIKEIYNSKWYEE
ncbi:MAG: hypothetical protein LBR37_03245 [Erysipelotrichaceae bacterium]|jgi:hypothetical protein|nr:hypothetical protein [Erysipelotrichaceae bacterium]